MPTMTVIATDPMKLIVESYTGYKISDSEYNEALEEAKRKLARIIEREGDADGERLQPYYIAQLISEALSVKRFSEYCKTNSKLRAIETKKKCPQPKPQGKSKSVTLLYHKIFQNAIGGLKKL